jgi:hypothetical protein
VTLDPWIILCTPASPLTLGSKGIEDKIEIKVGEIWLYNSEDCDMIAGLTTISTSKASATERPNWFGSAGVE